MNISTPIQSPIQVGIDLGGTKIEIVALDAAGRERFRKRVATPAHDYDAILRAIADLVFTVEAELGVSVTVGIGTPGAISPASGLIKNSNTASLVGRPLDIDLRRALARPVRVANDANCFALSEAVDGAARHCRVTFGVILGTGVGAGIAVDRKILPGANAIAGEWGHNPLPWPGDGETPGARCYCGLSGCIETFLSGPGLSRDHERLTGERLSPGEIAELAEKGHEPAGVSLRRYEDRLARALASVINVLDPDVIVLGGGLSNIRGLYAAVPALWSRYVFSDRVTTALRPALHGDASGVRGAARLWCE